MNALDSVRALWAFCESIDRKWEKEGYRTEVFPDIVEKHDTYRNCNLDSFSDLLFLRSCLDIPKVAEIQHISSFSDIYFRLFDNGRFWVEVLNWWGSDINIHDHDFSAVQYQLRGSALNVEYSFLEDGEHDGGVVSGYFEVRKASIWKPGQHSIVVPGKVAPHNICHIDIPTVSLLIRTYPDPSFGPQWNYFPPGIASSYGIADAVFRKNLKTLRLVAQHDEHRFREAVNDFVKGKSKHQRLFTAIKMVDFLFEDRYQGVLSHILEDDADMIKSVSYFRAMEELKYFKNVAKLDIEAKVALSVVGTAYDKSSLDDICMDIYGEKAQESILPPISSIIGKLDYKNQIRIASVLALYGLDVLGLESVA